MFCKTKLLLLATLCINAYAILYALYTHIEIISTDDDYNFILKLSENQRSFLESIYILYLYSCEYLDFI